jgi:hypothetical protein
MFIYPDRSAEWVTIPSRSIEDIELPEHAYKADFDMGKRGQDFSKELVRFSLFGVAGYGFLIKEILDRAEVIEITKRGPGLVLVSGGLLCLVFATGLGLNCQELTRDHEWRSTWQNGIFDTLDYCTP